MEKCISPTKKFLTVATITSLGIAITLNSLDLVSADQINWSALHLQDTKENSIVDWTKPISNAIEIIGKNLPVPEKYMYTISFGKDLGYFDVKYEQFSVEAANSPTISESNNIFVGKTTLTNDTDETQKLSTNSFSKSITNSVSNATTLGFKFGSKASASFHIPLVFDAGIEVSTEYSFSDTDTKTITDNYTYSTTAQNITVPAHSSVNVIVNLNRIKAKGNVNLIAKLSGSDRGNFVYSDKGYVYDMTFNQIVNRALKIQKLQNITANSDGKSVNLIGTGSYEAEYGTEFSVTVMPVEKGDKNERDINNRQKREINQGYTYKVKPQITKN